MFPVNPSAAGHPRWAWASILALLLAGWVASSCSSDSGILVSVTGEEVDSLEFHVGVVLQGGNNILIPEISGQQFDVRGRNLNASPYELFLREQDEGGDPATMRILSLGRRGEEIRALAITEPPQTFIRDELLQRSLLLTRTNGQTSAQQLGRSCWRVRQGDSQWRIFTDTDMDCDGSTTSDEPPDCDDGDEARYPGAAEVCDGKENNCDGQFAPGTQACYVRVKEVCRAGTRICGDAQSQGLDPTCAVSPAAKQVPEAYCREYEQCEGAAPLTCMESHLRRETLSCTINTKKDGGELCFVGVPLPTPVDESRHNNKCTWVLFETSGINMSFAEGTQQNTSTSCTPTLFLKRSGQAEVATADVEFIYGEGEDQDSVLILAELDLARVGDDGCPPKLSCE